MILVNRELATRWRAFRQRFPFIGSARFIGVVVVLIIIAALQSGWQIKIPLLSACWRETGPLQRLVTVIGTQRPIEARLTGGFAYGLYRAVPADPQPTSLTLSKPVSTIKDKILAQDIEHPSSESAQAAALVNLISGDIDAAIDRLETETKKTASNARLFNDLAACYLTIAQQHQPMPNLLRALAAVDRSLALDGQLLEARFNRALILERSFLLPEAKAAWRQYLQLEQSSEWRTEASNHLLKLNAITTTDAGLSARQQLAATTRRGDWQRLKELVRDNPDWARKYGIDELLPAWADYLIDGRVAEAEQALTAVRVIGEALVKHQQDNLLRDLVMAIDRSARRQAQHELIALATAHRLCRSAATSLKQYQIDAVISQSSQAGAIFARLGDVAGEANAMLLGTQWYSDYASANKKHHQLCRIAEQYGYPSVLGLAWRALGSLQGQQFEPAAALNSQRQALRYLMQIGDHAEIARTHFIIAEILSQIGETREIWQHQYKTLGWFSHSDKGIFPAVAYAAIATQLQRLDQPRAALYFSNEAVRLAQQSGEPVAIALTLRRRSAIHDSLQQPSAALVDLEKAREQIGLITDKLVYDRLHMDLSIVEGEYLLAQQPAQAADLFTTIIEKYRKTADRYYTTRLYRGRARAYLALGETLLAQADLKNSIDEFERQRTKVNKAEQRISFFQEMQPSYEKMIELQLAQGSTEKAFNYAEKARARALLDHFPGLYQELPQPSQKRSVTVKAPLTVAKIQTALPRDCAIVEYAVLPQSLSVWVITKDSFDLVNIAIDATTINSMSERLRSAMARRAPVSELNSLSIPLYDLLIRPLSRLLPQSARLTIVPDKGLTTLPFAALFNRETGHYLVEDYVVEVAPSATVFIYCHQRDRALASNNEPNLLIIGNPNFYQGRFPRLRNLPAAELEAKKIAAGYPAFEILLGKTATKSAFIQAAPEYRTIHFAGHAIESSPSAPYIHLLFASDDSGAVDNSLLSSYEIANLRLTQTRLIVLAACRTAQGPYAAGEGIISLSRAFIAAGAPSVAASLWDVNDEATAQLFITFHQEYRTGKDAATALRDSQLMMLRGDRQDWRSPAIWGAFTMLGGST